MNDRRFVNAMGVVAIVMGLIRIPSIFFNTPKLTRIGLTFGISVYPDPYNHPMLADPHEFNRGTSYSCEKNGHIVGQNNWSYHVRGGLSGPHRRTMSFGTYFNMVLKDSLDPDDQERFERLTRFYMCGDGPLAQLANCPTDIDTVTITARDPRYGVVIHEARVKCDQP